LRPTAPLRHIKAPAPFEVESKAQLPSPAVVEFLHNAHHGFLVCRISVLKQKRQGQQATLPSKDAPPETHLTHQGKSDEPVFWNEME